MRTFVRKMQVMQDVHENRVCLLSSCITCINCRQIFPSGSVHDCARPVGVRQRQVGQPVQCHISAGDTRSGQSCIFTQIS